MFQIYLDIILYKNVIYPFLIVSHSYIIRFPIISKVHWPENIIIINMLNT